MIKNRGMGCAVMHTDGYECDFNSCTCASPTPQEIFLPNGEEIAYRAKHPYTGQIKITAPQEEARCKSSPICSHNTQGRNLNKPCSVSSPFFPTWQEKEREMFNNLTRRIGTPYVNGKKVLTAEDLPKIFEHILSRMEQAKAEGANDALDAMNVKRETIRQAECARLVGIAQEMINCILPPVDCWCEHRECSKENGGYGCEITKVSILSEFISQAQAGEETK